jgi:preprotein translocase subunit SecE
MSTTTQEKKPGLGKFFKYVLNEMKKVHWPTKQEVINSLTVVLVLSGLLAFFIWIFDTVFHYGFTLL